MPSAQHLLAFVATSVVIVLIPGPSLLFMLGRALSTGRREALLAVVGNALGVSTQIAGIALGVGPVVAASPTAYLVLKLLGSGYLVYLGIRTILERHATAAALVEGAPAVTPSLHVLRDGFIVGLTNPKTVVFFAALLPQFVDPERGRVWLQMLVLGAVFAAIALTSDSTFALLAGKARDWFARSAGRMAVMSATGGAMMIVLAITLLFA